MTMASSLENAKFYDISSNGFLPESLPLKSFTDVYFSPWDEMINDGWRTSETVEEFWLKVEEMEILDAKRMKDSKENVRRAFSVLSFLSHMYVWADGEMNPKMSLPASLAIPWVEISEMLGVFPVLSHCAVDLWNHDIVDNSGKFEVDNLRYKCISDWCGRCLATFTGRRSEEVFYLVPTCIEYEGRNLVCECFNLPGILNTEDFQRTQQRQRLGDFLRLLESTIESFIITLRKIIEGCQPLLFYYEQRVFVAGFGFTDKMPNGLTYQGVKKTKDEEKEGDYIRNGKAEEKKEFFNLEELPEEGGGVKGKEKNGKVNMSSVEEKENILLLSSTSDLWMQRCLRGASAGQSSVIHLVDVLLGVDHSSPSTREFFQEMRLYMPGLHRRFLDDIALVARDMRKCIIESHKEELLPIFNSCVKNLIIFRKEHMSFVVRYIVDAKGRQEEYEKEKAKAVPAFGIRDMYNPRIPIVHGMLNSSNDCSNSIGRGEDSLPIRRKKVVGESLGEVGTGGTNLLVFLKTSREETAEAFLKKTNEEEEQIAKEIEKTEEVQQSDLALGA